MAQQAHRSRPSGEHGDERGRRARPRVGEHDLAAGDVDEVARVQLVHGGDGCGERGDVDRPAVGHEAVEDLAERRPGAGAEPAALRPLREERRVHQLGGRAHRERGLIARPCSSRALQARESGGDVDARPEHRRQRITGVLEPRRRRADREPAGIEPRRHLRPAQGERHRRAGQRADGERRHDRLPGPFCPEST